MDTQTTPRPPIDGLSDAALERWREINRDWFLELPQMMILAAALQSFDRMLQAKSIVDSEGLTIVDRFGTPRPHPAALLERDARSAMERALKSLNLDLEAVGQIGRPTGS